MNDEQLRAWRKQIDKTQKEAAVMLDMSPRRYRELESGRAEISEQIALACGAIANGITDYPPKEESDA